MGAFTLPAAAADGGAAADLGVALSHNAAVAWIVEGSLGRFDPLLMEAFQRGQFELEEIFQACPDAERALLSPFTPRLRTRQPGRSVSSVA